MSSTQIYHIMITILNVAILFILIKSFIKHFRGRTMDINFHSRMLLLCSFLLIANTFAFITSLYAYFVFSLHVPEVLNFGRFADRYCMFFAYLSLDRINERY